MRIPGLFLLGTLALTACDGDGAVDPAPVGTTGAATDGDASKGDDDDDSAMTDATPSTSGDDDDSGGTPTTTSSTTSSSTSDASTTADATTASTGGETTSDTESDSDSDSEGGGTECAELESCCDQIGADVYAGCITVVDMGNAGLCTQILATYHGEGYCTGEAYCDELGACCGEMPDGPGWADTCNYYADLGNQPQCAMLIGDYQLSDYCL